MKPWVYNIRKDLISDISNYPQYQITLLNHIKSQYPKKSDEAFRETPNKSNNVFLIQEILKNLPLENVQEIAKEFEKIKQQKIQNSQRSDNSIKSGQSGFPSLRKSVSSLVKSVSRSARSLFSKSSREQEKPDNLSPVPSKNTVKNTINLSKSQRKINDYIDNFTIDKKFTGQTLKFPKTQLERWNIIFDNIKLALVEFGNENGNQERGNKYLNQALFYMAKYPIIQKIIKKSTFSDDDINQFKKDAKKIITKVAKYIASPKNIKNVGHNPTNINQNNIEIEVWICFIPNLMDLWQELRNDIRKTIDKAKDEKHNKDTKKKTQPATTNNRNKSTVVTITDTNHLPPSDNNRTEVPPLPPRTDSTQPALEKAVDDILNQSSNSISSTKSLDDLSILSSESFRSKQSQESSSTRSEQSPERSSTRSKQSQESSSTIISRTSQMSRNESLKQFQERKKKNKDSDATKYNKWNTEVKKCFRSPGATLKTYK